LRFSDLTLLPSEPRRSFDPFFTVVPVYYMTRNGANISGLLCSSYLSLAAMSRMGQITWIYAQCLGWCACPDMTPELNGCNIETPLTHADFVVAARDNDAPGPPSPRIAWGKLPSICPSTAPLIKHKISMCLFRTSPTCSDQDPTPAIKALQRDLPRHFRPLLHLHSSKHTAL